MPNIKKFVVGIRPATKMFRISSVGGEIVDALLAARGGNIGDSYYSQVSTDKDSQLFQLSNKALGNILTIDRDNVTITKDLYDTDTNFHFDNILSEFRTIWKTLNAILEVRDIRRIGVVAEHQEPIAGSENPSKILASAYTKLSPQGHPAKLLLRFEDRQPLPGGQLPDFDKNDFINTIIEIYDSEVDVDHPKERSINFNVDAQHYYAPVFNGNVPDEVLKLYNKTLTPSIKHWHANLLKNGVLNGR